MLFGYRAAIDRLLQYTFVVLVRHLIDRQLLSGGVLEAMVDSRLVWCCPCCTNRQSTTGRLTAWRSWRTCPGLPLPCALSRWWAYRR